MHVADLETRTPVVEAAWVRAVGWLAGEAPVPHGRLSGEFLERLRSLCAVSFESAVALGWPVAAGLHTCELCGAEHAGGNVGVPGRGVLFVAPEMVAHYVEAHGYAPPREFVAAVLDCPIPGTQEYVTAVRRFVRRE